MNPHKIIADYIKARTGNIRSLVGSLMGYDTARAIGDLGDNDFVTKQHLINSTTPISILTSIPAGASLPVNIDLTSYNFTKRPIVIVSMGSTATREKIIYDVEIFYNFNAGKSQVLSIDVLGHDNGSNINLDDLFITITP